jgi:hypothetical protein
MKHKGSERWHFFVAGEWLQDRNGEGELTMEQRMIAPNEFQKMNREYTIISEREYIVSYLHVGHSDHWKLMPVGAK